jgi:hypothetical protein
MSPWYVVFNGHKPGVYSSWDECHDQVNRFPGNSYKKYNTYGDAQAAINSRNNSNLLLCGDDDLSSPKPTPPPPSLSIKTVLVGLLVIYLFYLWINSGYRVVASVSSRHVLAENVMVQL